MVESVEVWIVLPLPTTKHTWMAGWRFCSPTWGWQVGKFSLYFSLKLWRKGNSTSTKPLKIWKHPSRWKSQNPHKIHCPGLILQIGCRNHLFFWGTFSGCHQDQFSAFLGPQTTRRDGLANRAACDLPRKGTKNGSRFLKIGHPKRKIIFQHLPTIPFFRGRTVSFREKLILLKKKTYSKTRVTLFSLRFRIPKFIFLHKNVHGNYGIGNYSPTTRIKKDVNPIRTEKKQNRKIQAPKRPQCSLGSRNLF